MTKFFDDREIAISCRKCGRDTRKSIAWVKANEQFTCVCGTNFALDDDEFVRGLADIEASIGSMFK